jgi:hypothetical protein
MIIDEEYYPLSAATIIGCSIDDLLFLGAMGKITIRAITRGFYAKRSKLDVTTGKFNIDGIRLLPDAPEIHRNTILRIVSSDIPSFHREEVKQVSLTGEGKFRYKTFKFESKDEMFVWEAPFSRSESSFDEQMNHIDGNSDLILTQKDFVLTEQELLKAHALTSFSNTRPAYIDDSHPMFSRELSIAIEAWQQVLSSNPPKQKTGSRKKLIIGWLEKHHKQLPKEAKERIARMLNPDGNGGAPSLE